MRACTTGSTATTTANGGALHVEGEHFADCSTAESVARLNPFRDCLIELRDPQTAAVGIGNCQTWVQGSWPELGLPDG